LLDDILILFSRAANRFYDHFYLALLQHNQNYAVIDARAVPTLPCGPINSLDNYRTFCVDVDGFDFFWSFLFLVKCNENKNGSRGNHVLEKERLFGAGDFVKGDIASKESEMENYGKFVKKL
jgi:hypothetical protein